jgi:hypothetical protein
MLHQLQQAIEPAVHFKNILENWDSISKALSEKSRKRVPALDNLNF